MKVRSYGYTVPVDATCAACGLPFKAGDSVTLNPTRHRECDPTAVFLDAAIARSLDALTHHTYPNDTFGTHEDGPDRVAATTQPGPGQPPTRQEVVVTDDTMAPPSDGI